jgi:beta-lactamase superfamily II metal-dependent hydrolase
VPYTLEIHHIDVGQGDSTLILVRDEANANAISTSVLIDGGLATASGPVDTYVRGQGVADLDIMVASHFDKDHFYGLTELLADTSSSLCDHTTIYDRGEWGNVDQFGNVTGRKNDFTNYLDAIALVNTRSRPTSKVAAQGAANIPQDWRPAHWLVGRTLFSLNGGNTSMTCVVANKWVNGVNNYKHVEGTQAVDDNPFSLGLLIRHNNFRYFTAGDLMIAQEEEAAAFLNPNNNNAGHVCAIKASHHGAAKSTSAAYLARLLPRAIFLSCGFLNGYGHPKDTALNNIEGSPRIQYYYLSSCGSAVADARLLGCSGHNLNQVTQNVMGRVAGDRPRGAPVAHRGDIVLRVSNAQSLMNPHQFGVTYYENDNGANLTNTHTC